MPNLQRNYYYFKKKKRKMTRKLETNIMGDEIYGRPKWR